MSRFSNSNFNEIGILSGNLGGRGINVLYPPAPLVAAKVDGTTDDTAAIQASLDYVGQAGGGIVYVPPGICKIKSLFFNYDNITFTGSGFSTWFKVISGTGYCIFNNWDERNTDQTPKGKTGIEIKNFRLWCNRLGVSIPGATWGHAFNFNKVKHMTIENVWIENTYGDGIRVMHDFTDHTNAGLSENLKIRNCIVDDFGRSGIGVESQIGCIIDDNVITNQLSLTQWTGEGLPSDKYDEGCAVEVEADQNYRSLQYLSVQRNRVKNCPQHGLKIHAAPVTSMNAAIQHNGYIKDNYVENCVKSIYVRLFTDCEIAGNQIVNDQGVEGAISIFHGSFNINIHDNLIDGVPGGNGIHVEDLNFVTDTSRLAVNHIKMHHNQIYNAGYAGIRVAANVAGNVNYISIEDNEIINPCGNASDTNKYGIYAWSGMSDLKVKGNKVIDKRTTNLLRFGIVIPAGSPSVGYCEGNVVIGQTIGAISDGAGGLRIRNNIGYVNDNYGTATVSAAATSVTIAHGLNGTPSINGIQLTPTNNLGTSTKYWISAVTATTFTITVDSAPGGTGAIFAWLARL